MCAPAARRLHFRSHYTAAIDERASVASLFLYSLWLDPIPTSLLKEHAVTLAPTITNIVNLSMLTGEIPAELKQAIVTPLLKQSSLDPNILKHYRPVSNLSYVSKLLEKVVAIQLSQHLLNNNLYEPYQSAYRTCHNTETALTRVSIMTFCKPLTVSSL